MHHCHIHRLKYLGESFVKYSPLTNFRQRVREQIEKDKRDRAAKVRTLSFLPAVSALFSKAGNLILPVAKSNPC